MSNKKLTKECKKALQRWKRASDKIAGGRVGVAQANSAMRNLNKTCGKHPEGLNKTASTVTYFRKIGGKHF